MIARRSEACVNKKVYSGEIAVCFLVRLAVITMASKTSRADFESVWPSLVADLSEAATKYNVPPNALEWFQKVRILCTHLTETDFVVS